MAYLRIACSVYLYIATVGANIRICRISSDFDRSLLPGIYAMRAPVLCMFPLGARKVSQVQVPFDSKRHSSTGSGWRWE